MIHATAIALLLLLPATLWGWSFEPYYGIGPAQGEFAWSTSGEHADEGAFVSTLKWEGLQSRRERLGVKSLHRFFEFHLFFDRGTIREGSVEDTDRYDADSHLNSQTRHSSGGEHRGYGIEAGVHLGDRDLLLVPQLVWFQRSDRYTIGSGYDPQTRTVYPTDSRYEAVIQGLGAALRLESRLRDTITLQGGMKAIVASYEADAYWDQRDEEHRHFSQRSEGTLRSSWVQANLDTGLNLTLWGRFEKNRFKGQPGEDTTPAANLKQPFDGADLDEHLWLFGLQAHF